jgi:hypothetical protein
VNVALVAPAATVTLAGTVAAAVLLLPSVTAAPPAGAALLSITVPVEEAPPVTLAGFRVTEVTTAAGGFTVSVKLCEAFVPTPLLAVIVREYVPPLPDDGVPLSAAVPFPLLWNVTPLGSVPVSAYEGVGVPVVVIAKLPAVPAVNVALLALLIAGCVEPLSEPPVNVRIFAVDAFWNTATPGCPVV